MISKSYFSKKKMPISLQSLNSWIRRWSRISRLFNRPKPEKIGQIRKSWRTRWMRFGTMAWKWQMLLLPIMSRTWYCTITTRVYVVKQETVAANSIICAKIPTTVRWGCFHHALQTEIPVDSSFYTCVVPIAFILFYTHVNSFDCSLLFNK